MAAAAKLSGVRHRKIYVKATGDLTQRADFILWVRDLMRAGAYTVVGVGGGTDITKALNKAKIRFRFNRRGSRVIKSFSGRLLAEGTLRWNKKRLEDRFARHDAYPQFFVPVLDVAGVTVHVNGDEFPKLVYDTFDEVWIATLKGRELTKRKQFADYPRVKIKTFPVELPPKFRRKGRS